MGATGQILAAITILAAAGQAAVVYPELRMSSVREVAKTDLPLRDRYVPLPAARLPLAAEPWYIAFTPDCAKLVFWSGPYRPKGPRRRETGGAVLVLRSLSTGRQTPIMPVAVQNFIHYTDLFFYWLKVGNPFSKDGQHVLVPLFIDADGDGVHGLRERDPRRRTMGIGLASLKTGRLVKRLKYTGEFIFATFDGSGEGLLVVAAWFAKEAQGQQLHVELPGRRLAWRSAPFSHLYNPCPSYALAAVEVDRTMKVSNGRTGLYLYDYLANKLITRLPTRTGHAPSVWTKDGHYLCYCTADWPKRPDRATMIWDRAASKLVHEADIGRPGGTGPTPTTIVTHCYGGGMRLHDAATGRTWAFGPKYAQLLAARDGKVLYLIRQPGSPEVVFYLAEIAMPAQTHEKEADK